MLEIAGGGRWERSSIICYQLPSKSSSSRAVLPSTCPGGSSRRRGARGRGDGDTSGASRSRRPCCARPSSARAARVSDVSSEHVKSEPSRLVHAPHLPSARRARRCACAAAQSLAVPTTARALKTQSPVRQLVLAPTHLIVGLADLLYFLLLLTDKAVEAPEVELLAVRVLDGLDEGRERLKVLRSARDRVQRNLRQLHLAPAHLLELELELSRCECRALLAHHVARVMRRGWCVGSATDVGHPAPDGKWKARHSSARDLVPSGTTRWRWSGWCLLTPTVNGKRASLSTHVGVRIRRRG